MKEQMREAFEALSSEQLRSLYFKFIEYRDSECNGMAQMSVQEFYKKYGA
jgi:hypothetical protein